MANKIIFSSLLQEFRPVIWYGEPVHSRYAQLKTALEDQLGTAYAEILAEPSVSPSAEAGNGEAHWLADFSETPTAYPKLPPSKQEEVRLLLATKLEKIKQFANKLKAEEDKNRQELGEIMLLATELPGLDYIFSANGKIVLTLWGFTSETAQKTDFRISKVLEKPAAAFIPPAPPPTPPAPVELTPTSSITTTTVKETVAEQPVEAKPEKDEKKKKPWLWMLIGALIMFLLLFLIWFFFLKNPAQQTYLPPTPGVLPPVDTTETGIDPDDPTKRKIFTNKLNVALNKGADINSFAKTIGEKYADNLEIVYYDTVINLLQLKTPPEDWKKWADSLRTEPAVRLTFNESLFNRSIIPTDPAFADEKKSWYFKTIQAYKAWDITKGNPDIVIAVIDNGFDLTHPEFKGKIIQPWNVFKSSADVFAPKVAGGMHGTHVAATAAGLMGNNEGLSGIAPNCKIMPIQVADKNGTMTSLSIVSGILYAIHKNADVVNMSLGMMFPEQVKSLPDSEQEKLTDSLYPNEAKFWDELYSFAQESNIVFVQAAGNDNIMAGIDPAARSKNTIIVSAFGVAAPKASFSNYGKYSVISAPGVEIYSAVPGGKYASLQGTSMASPIVAGAVALIKSKRPEMKPNEIIELLVNTAKPLNSTPHIGPLLQIANALNGDTSATDMVIPENPSDLTFAEGRWKSTTPLTSTIDKSNVSLYFEIKKDGNGELELVEEKSDGKTCRSPLEITFKDGKLIMIQTGNAECDGGGKFYRPYQFVCVQGKNNTAECKASEKGKTGKIIEFGLKKIK